MSPVVPLRRVVATAAALLATLPLVVVAAPLAVGAPDPRRTQPLYVDPYSQAAGQDDVYRTSIGARPQSLWVLPESFPTDQVRARVADYAGRAVAAGSTPSLVVYGIPDRDCGQSSAGGLPDAAAYRSWVGEVADGLRGTHALVVLEPDAIALMGSCPTPGRLAMLRSATRTLHRAGAWVYLDAGHSAWTPYAGRAHRLVKAGIRWARGFSTNVSNVRPTHAEQRYAALLLRQLRGLGVRGKHYVVDTSRNGARPRDHDVINPPWARLGAAPRLVFRGAFDGRLWVKRPGESDGYAHDGPGAGQWCDRLADRLLGRPDGGVC